MGPNHVNRRWYQFSLRGLLLFVALLSGALAFWVAQIRPYKVIGATYDRLGARGAVQTGDIENVELAWYQRPFLGAGWYGKCATIWFRGEPSAADFDDLRSVAKDGLNVNVACPFSDSAAKQLAGMNIGSFEVDLEGNMSHAGWEMLRGKPIRSLTVRTFPGEANKFSGHDLELCNEFRDLHSLVFEAFTLTDRDFSVLKPIPGLSAVVIRARISDGALAFLAGAKLKYLLVEGDAENPVTGAGLSAIKDVERLDLDSKGLTDASLAEISRWQSLRELRLTFTTAITRAGLKSLADAQRLESLRLDFVNITDDDLPILAACKNLKRLSLRGTKVTGVGLGVLSKLPLEDLDLIECPLTVEAAEVILRMPGSFSVNVEPKVAAKFREKLGARVRADPFETW